MLNISIRLAAFFLSAMAALLLTYDIYLREYGLSWFLAAFNFLFLVEYGAIAFAGRSPLTQLYRLVKPVETIVFIAIKGLNVGAALVFLFWSCLMVWRTHASSDVMIVGIQVFFTLALLVALTVNVYYYREEHGVRWLNLVQITAITYAVSVFMAARLLQGSVILPASLLAVGMANIALALLAAFVMNPSEFNPKK